MPTAKDVTVLRKAGKIDEAFALATQLLIEQPDNIYNKQAMGWVRYERLKAVAKTPNMQAFLAEWKAASDLFSNWETEKMLSDNLAWQAISKLFNITDEGQKVRVLDSVFESVNRWTFEKPSQLYSALLNAFLKAGKNWPKLGYFVLWWNLDNLSDDDFISKSTSDGKEYMSLAEQAHIVSAKYVMENGNPDAIQQMIERLDILHKKYPKYKYPAYFLAKLLVAKGAKAEALKALLPFARRKKTEFWIWELLADLHSDEPETELACLFRAVSNPAQNKFSIKVRERLARKLSAQGRYCNALVEVLYAMEIKKKEGWGASVQEMEKLKLVPLCKVPKKDNKDLYRSCMEVTENLLLTDIEEMEGVITFVNTEKETAFFVVSKSISGSFKYAKTLTGVKAGDFVFLRLDERTGKDGKYWAVISVRPTTNLPSAQICKQFSGKLKKVAGKDFGFVDDIFLSPALIKEAENGTLVSGIAIYQLDKVKKSWKWKVIKCDFA